MRARLAGDSIRGLAERHQDRGDRPNRLYASGIRAALPVAKIAVDKWHMVALANQMVTEFGNATKRRISSHFAATRQQRSAA
jgi:hypothetical protein